MVTTTLFLILQQNDLAVGLRDGISFTARYSLAFFSITFVASSLQLLSKSSLVNWIRKNRRYFGLTFAVSHLVHGLAIYVLYLEYPVLFEQIVSPTSKIFGGIGFFVIFILALTSSNYAIKKIGHAKWKNLHLYGSYYIWVIFLFSYVGRAPSSVVYASVVGLLLLSVVLRFLQYRKTSKVNITSNL